MVDGAGRPYHHGNLRRALLEQAERALAERGAEGLSLRELARAVGVSHAAPRRHFADRRALLDALAQDGFERLARDLHGAVDEIAAGLSRVDQRVDGSLTNTAVVRYDAYAGTGGHQSASFAFLDANRTGTVVTAIQGRDYARLYVKELDRGRAPIALSPEELEAVERAMAR